jgi:hypothetical protein
MAKLKSRIRETKELAQHRADRQHLNEAIEQIEELKLQVSAIKRLQRSTKTYGIVSVKGRDTSEATIIATASDWHVGSEITLGSTNGLNEFNVAIARDRAKKFFERIVRLTNKERQDIDIPELVLFLGGDFIEGSLHLDTIMGSDISGTMNQLVEVQALLSSGLDYIIKAGGFKNITVICADGNHGRVSVKQHFHSRRGNSAEYFMYYNLAARYPQLNWVINESMLTYLPVYDKKIAFMHGDRISFGGMNGFYTYLHRRIDEWNTSPNKADYFILGHLHCYTPTRRYLVNGSMCGYNAFSMALSARFEPPTQGLMLWDKKRGPTVHIPVLFT